MRLLIFCPYYPPHIGGLENHADEFNKYLSQKGIDITVFTTHLPKSSPEKEIRYNNVKIIRFPAFEIISNYPLPKFWKIKFWKLFFSLFKEKFNIVISRTRFFNTSLLAMIYARIKNIKWIHIEHGSDFVRLSSNFKSFIAKTYDNIFGRLIFKNSNLNISISEAVQKFVNKFDKRNSPIIYRGLDIAKIENIPRDIEFRNQYKDKLIISWTGRIYKWKGVEKSIIAILKLPQKIKEKILFVIIGDGEDRKNLQKISNNSIVFIGSISREKALGILKISDIYLHSSLPGGGLSTSLLEAMLCGCAIISSPNEGANEIIKNNTNGLLISYKDVEEIKDKLIFLINNTSIRRKLASNAKLDTSNNFQWSKSIEKYLNIFKKCLELQKKKQ